MPDLSTHHVLFDLSFPPLSSSNSPSFLYVWCEWLFQLDPLPEPCVAVPRVPPGAQPARANLRVDLLHHLAKVCGGERLQPIVSTVVTEGKSGERCNDTDVATI